MICVRLLQGVWPIYKSDRLYEQILADLVQLQPHSMIASRHGMSRKFNVARATVDKVIRSLEEKGIVYSIKGKGTFVASGKGSERKNTWGVILPNVMSDVYPGILRGIEDVARGYGINAIICNTDHDIGKENEYIRRLILSGVGGLIVVPAIAGKESREVYDMLHARGIPFVFCNRSLDQTPYAPLVCSNGYYGMFLATKHLYAKGYERIAYISCNRYVSSIERFNGYAGALAELGIAVDPGIVHTQMSGEEEILPCATRMLKGPNPPDAFLCFNDRVASQVYRAIISMGLRISDDVGLMGYDNSDICEVFDVKLSSVDYKNIEIGRKAGEILHEMSTGVYDAYCNVHTFIPRLVVRESCLGPVRRFAVVVNANFGPAESMNHRRENP